jgi:hypothetical protein
MGSGPRVDAFTAGMPSRPPTSATSRHTRCGRASRRHWPAASGRSSRSRGQLGTVPVGTVPVGTVPVGVLSRPQRHRRPLSAADQDRVGRYAHTATVLLRAPANVNDAGQVNDQCTTWSPKSAPTTRPSTPHQRRSGISVGFSARTTGTPRRPGTPGPARPAAGGVRPAGQGAPRRWSGPGPAGPGRVRPRQRRSGR